LVLEDGGVEGIRRDDLLEDVVLLEIGEYAHAPARGGSRAGPLAQWKLLEGAVIAVQGEAGLLEVVGALHARCGLAHFLDGGQQQADEDGDDRDDDEQLDEREGRPPTDRETADHG